MVGSRADPRDRARSSLALTAFVTPLVLSLFALIPDIGIRVPSLVAGLGGVLFAVGAARQASLSKKAGHGWRQIAFLAGFALISVLQIVIGIVLQVEPDWEAGPTIYAALLIALLGIGIDRACELVGGAPRSTSRSLTQLLAPDRVEPDEAPPKE